MGKRTQEPDGEGKGKKRSKKRKGYATLRSKTRSRARVREVLLRTGGRQRHRRHAVNDAVEAYRRAWESRREKHWKRHRSTNTTAARAAGPASI